MVGTHANVIHLHLELLFPFHTISNQNHVTPLFRSGDVNIDDNHKFYVRRVKQSVCQTFHQLHNNSFDVAVHCYFSF